MVQERGRRRAFMNRIPYIAASSETERSEPAVYLIVQKVWTSASFGRREVGQFIFLPYQTESPYRRAWLAVTIVETVSWQDAYKSASRSLIRLIDALHVILQCAFSIAGASWFIWTLHKGKGTVVANIFRPDSVVPMELWEDRQIRDIRRLDAVDEAALLYFRESSRASTAKTRLAMLVVAAEALAGEDVTVPECSKCEKSFSCAECQQVYKFSGTNKAHLQAILGAELHRRLYKGKKPVRHRLMHGKLIDESEAGELAQETYTTLRSYLQRHAGLKSDLAVHNAPRPLDGSTQDFACLIPPAGWLAVPIDHLKVVWADKLRQLESSELQLFGETIHPLPLDL